MDVCCDMGEFGGGCVRADGLLVTHWRVSPGAAAGEVNWLLLAGALGGYWLLPDGAGGWELPVP